MGLFMIGSAFAAGAGAWFVGQYRMNKMESQFDKDIAELKGQITLLHGADRLHDQQVAVFSTKLDAVIETLRKIERILENGSNTPHGNE